MTRSGAAGIAVASSTLSIFLIFHAWNSALAFIVELSYMSDQNQFLRDWTAGR